MEKNGKEYKEITVMLKTDGKRMATSWLAFIHIDFIEERKVVIEHESGEECEILWRRTPNGDRRFALFFKNGYFQYDHKKYRHDFISINN